MEIHAPIQGTKQTTLGFGSYFPELTFSHSGRKVFSALVNELTTPCGKQFFLPPVKGSINLYESSKMVTYVLMVLGFVVLIKGADWLVKGASDIAARFQIPELVVGLTIVAFGTSTPELFVNVFASLNGNPEIAIGNILGSNIANIFLILGVSAIIFPLTVQSSTVWKEVPFSLLAALVAAILANDIWLDGQSHSAISRIDGLVLLAFFSIFLIYIFEISRKEKSVPAAAAASQMSVSKSLLFTLLGITGLIFGGTWIVNGAVALASSLGVSESLVGLTIVAVGTSLPELATSVVAAYRKNTAIAIGNVVGSNIFNIFFILGISSLVKPLPLQPSSNADFLISILASLLLFAFLFLGRRHVLDRPKGILFILLYAGYVAFLIIRG